MSFDIGIGKCIAVSRDTVDLHADISVVHKYFPDLPWQRQGTSVLRVPVSCCSTLRKPEVGEEVYLSEQSLGRNQKGWLDALGDGSFESVSLSRIVDGMSPGESPPSAAPKVRWR